MFSKILIANRGEIACRIIRTAHALGVRCVAIYSDADRDALHVQMADECIHIGDSPPIESYLNIKHIIKAAQQSGAEAIHPGYGFLAENADFARHCNQAGLVFIGPSAAAIAAMGSKSAAKQRMENIGIPVLPGYHGEDQSLKALKYAADTIGYPLLIKPSAGGGGKGMFIVTNSNEFASALQSAKRQAMAAFGDEQILLEKYLHHPRHIEVQIFIDHTSQGVYLFERDCSVQRRHQKIIEEAPAPGVNAKLRERIGKTALNVAHAISYQGAGTVEFLLDSDQQFYFMEMNTRLQVEHPVTEMITSLDLVEWQLRIACGEPLPLKQEALTLSGHAIEARIYAENPDNDFLPDAGKLTYYREPETNQHIRVDSGVRENAEISMYYDPMIAKLIVWHNDRDRAIHLMQRALHQFRVAGINTNIAFLKKLIAHPSFQTAEIDTGFLDRNQLNIIKPGIDEQYFHLACAAASCYLLGNTKNADPQNSPWDTLRGWQLNTQKQITYELIIDKHIYSVKIKPDRSKDTFLDITIDNRSSYLLQAQLDDDRLAIQYKNRKYLFYAMTLNQDISLFTETDTFIFQRSDNFGDGTLHEKDVNSLHAPINGRVIAVETKPNETVSQNTTLIVLEAMKMEHALKSPRDGIIEQVLCRPGDQIQAGTELLTFKTS